MIIRFLGDILIPVSYVYITSDNYENSFCNNNDFDQPLAEHAITFTADMK